MYLIVYQRLTTRAPGRLCRNLLIFNDLQQTAKKLNFFLAFTSKRPYYVYMKTIDMTPTWESAVKIYIAVLENENASAEGKQVAREELVFLAKTVDQLSKVKNEEAKQNG